MAEIKRYQKAQVFNQPVGVVRATGAEAASRAWAGVATAGQRIFEMGYQEAKVQQKALGDNFAKMSVIGRDDAGIWRCRHRTRPYALQRRYHDPAGALDGRASGDATGPKLCITDGCELHANTGTVRLGR